MKIKSTVKNGEKQSSVTITDEGINVSFSDEIETLEEDIIGIRKNMGKAIFHGDANLYGKWMNNYRDALQLREELKKEKSNNKRKDVITNFNINIDGSNAENIDNEKIQEIIDGLVRKEVKQPMYIIENNVYGYKITDSNKHDEIKYQIKDEQGKVVGVASDIEWINPI